MTSCFGARYTPGAGFAVTGGNGGTGSCLTVQPSNSFSSFARISAVEKSPWTARIMFDGKK